MIGAQPVLVAQEVVYLVGEDELLKLNVLLAQAAHERDRLTESDVAIIVAVNQEDVRTPLVDRKDRRRLARNLRALRRVERHAQARDQHAPIVDAVQVNTGGEEIGIARKAERRQIAAIRAAPETDVLWINRTTLAQILRSRNDVLILGCATRAPVLRFTKRAPVADAAAIVDREHRVAATGEILIERVGVVIVVEIMPAEEHLAHGAAVHKDDGGRAAH